MLSNGLRASAIALIVGLVSAPAAMAQDEGEYPGTGCDLDVTTAGCPPGGHHAGYGTQAGGNWHYYPPTCYQCVTGNTSDCHPACSPSPRPDLAAAYLALREAAARGDAKAMMRLAPLAPGFVTINTARQAIQLKNCKGDDIIIASLRVADAKALATLASSLRAHTAVRSSVTD